MFLLNLDISGLIDNLNIFPKVLKINKEIKDKVTKEIFKLLKKKKDINIAKIVYTKLTINILNLICLKLFSEIKFSNTIDYNYTL